MQPPPIPELALISPSHEIALVITVFVLFLVLMAGAQRVRIPDPVVLVGGGTLLALVPGVPEIALSPELVLLVFLPPLLFAEAFNTSWRDFKANLRPITLLAVGLDLATAGAVAVVAHMLFPALPWAACFALGAVLAPTDAVSAMAIVSQLPVPQRIVTILVGEALVNDATALVAYNFAIAAALTGTFSAPEAAGRFFLVAVGGVTLGLAVGWLVIKSRHLFAGDHRLENVSLLVTPFAVYLLAERLHLSGVLAVVACGLWVGRRHSELYSSRTRVNGRALWELLVFVLNGLLFVLVGLELRTILAEPGTASPFTLLGEGMIVAGVVIATRLLWVFPATYLPRMLSRRVREADPSPSPRSVAVIAWAGMRGGISLAAALAIPAVLADGTPFPGRSAIIVVTFIVILCTLCVQGMTLPVLIGWLGLDADGQHEREEAKARLHAAKAAQARFDELALEGQVPPELEGVLRRRLSEQVHRLTARHKDEPDERLEARVRSLAAVRTALTEAQRHAVIDLRNRGVIADEVLQHLETEWDLDLLRHEDAHGGST